MSTPKIGLQATKEKRNITNMTEFYSEKETFPEYHPLYLFNDYVYMVSGHAGANHPIVYIFRWNDTDGVVVSINEARDYFKGVVRPIIFTDEYNWREADNKGSYAIDNMDGLVNRLISMHNHALNKEKPNGN